MSTQSTFSRRELVSLLGVTTGSAVVTTVTAQTAVARSHEVIRAATSTRPHYVFGYGSLIERESRMRTWPSAEFASPVVVKGIARGWFDHTDVPSWSPTYLGGLNEEGAECNVRGFPRHLGGARQLRPARDWLQADEDRPIAGHYARRRFGLARRRHLVLRQHAHTRKRFASVEHPIVQSYVDVCLNGCLEIEAMYPLAKQASFAEQFITTTGNWGPPWINDRIHPWRPFLYVPRAWAIDALLQKVLGQENAQITFK